LGFLLGFLALLVHAIGSNTFLTVRIMEPFWLFAALVVRGLLIAEATQSTVHSPQTHRAARKEAGSSIKAPASVVKPGLVRFRKL